MFYLSFLLQLVLEIIFRFCLTSTMPQYQNLELNPFQNSLMHCMFRPTVVFIRRVKIRGNCCPFSVFIFTAILSVVNGVSSTLQTSSGTGTPETQYTWNRRRSCVDCIWIYYKHENTILSIAEGRAVPPSNFSAHDDGPSKLKRIIQ
jgi:uncharacterized protein YggT (Ycf19 family)